MIQYRTCVKELIFPTVDRCSSSRFTLYTEWLLHCYDLCKQLQRLVCLSMNKDKYSVIWIAAPQSRIPRIPGAIHHLLKSLIFWQRQDAIVRYPITHEHFKIKLNFEQDRNFLPLRIKQSFESIRTSLFESIYCRNFTSFTSIFIKSRQFDRKRILMSAGIIILGKRWITQKIYIISDSPLWFFWVGFRQ